MCVWLCVAVGGVCTRLLLAIAPRQAPSDLDTSLTGALYTLPE